MRQSFKETVSNYRNSKKRRTGSSVISFKEYKNLKEDYEKGTGERRPTRTSKTLEERKLSRRNPSRVRESARGSESRRTPSRRPASSTRRLSLAEKSRLANAKRRIAERKEATGTRDTSSRRIDAVKSRRLAEARQRVMDKRRSESRTSRTEQNPRARRESLTERTSATRKVRPMRTRPGQPSRNLVEAKRRLAMKKRLQERAAGRTTTGRKITALEEAKRTLVRKNEASRVKPNTNKSGSLANLVENYRKYKENAGKGSKITIKELSELKEAFKATRGRLREADAAFDVTEVAVPVEGQVDVANPAAVDPTVLGNIQSVIDAVDNLSNSVGMDVGTGDLGADPMADIPPVEGQPVQAAEVAPIYERVSKEFMKFKKRKTGSAKLTESEKRELMVEATKIAKTRKTKVKSKVDSLKERIAKRNEDIKRMSEDKAAQGVGEKALSNIGPRSMSKFNYGDRSPSVKQGTNAESQLKAPTAAQAAKGVNGGKGTAPGKTWPTKDIKSVGNLQGKGAANSKVKESLNKKINKSAQEITDEYVDKALNEEKLDFNSITNSIAKGYLG